ncbi:CRISPR-associated exonuclease, Cas4 family [Desulfocicer vacuolatum DSM 3385]|uniref:CRISPR-associated exonuclease Cas4 n=2 Tax=Desulfocicer vacuolatum TaxID=2298 RepID=A0A1W2BZJ7_9BACT|nr:CRISPR-associated exonuclease, Cas4 family [Desulfocicer vacuolatum DSM 3385]
METLSIPQKEGNRFKVLKGREVHKQKTLINKSYLRKKLEVVEKQSNVYLSSAKYQLRGVIDEVLTFSDNTMAPLDFKYAEYKKINYKTHKIQALCYCLLIEDNFQKKANKAFIVYTRSKNKLIDLNFNDKDRKNLDKQIKEVINIIITGYYPKKTSSKKRCVDCCYRNICEN